MAARFKGKEYTFASTAPVKLTTILGLPSNDFVSTLVMRAAKANAADVVWGGSDLTVSTNRWGFLDSGDAVGIDLSNKYFNTDEVYIAGEANDIVHISWIQ